MRRKYETLKWKKNTPHIYTPREHCKVFALRRTLNKRESDSGKSRRKGHDEKFAATKTLRLQQTNTLIPAGMYWESVKNQFLLQFKFSWLAKF